TPPTLTADGLPPVSGQPLSGHGFRFTFPGRTPTFPAVSGSINVHVSAKDAVGNPSTASSAFQMSRMRWTWIKPRGQGISTAPAITGALLLVGGDESHVYGIRRITGETVWDVNVIGAPIGHVAVGQSRAYVATTNGHVVGL